MAESTDEEHLGDSTYPQAENPSEDIISTKDPETFNSNPQIENMEVHKHPHHVTHRKKWGEYLLEFLMLFLAVFLGFLAENWREQLVERHREKEYMSSMTEDLRSDTAELQSNIDLCAMAIDKSNRLINLLYSKDPTADIPSLYRFNISRVVIARLEDRTSSQLKNAGGMRLILNSKVSNAIREYWNINKTMENITDRMESVSTKARDIGGQIFSNKYVSLLDKMHPVISDIVIDPAATLIDNDSKLLAQYANARFLINIILTNYLQVMKIEKLKAIALIGLIKKEYHLD